MEWSEVKPVLKATYHLLAEQQHIAGEDVIAALGRPAGDEATGRVLRSLHEAGYINGRFAMQATAPVLIFSTEKGLQETSSWPKPDGTATDHLDLLLRLLDEQIASDATPENEKGKLVRARDAFAALGRDIAVGVLTAYASRVTGASGESA